MRIAIAAALTVFAACRAQPRPNHVTEQGTPRITIPPTREAPARRGLSLSATTARASIVPYGVAAPDGSSIYLINDRGMIDAVDTRTGATRWTSEAQGEPLLVVDGMVFALVGARVVACREASPAIVWSSDELPFGKLRSVRLEEGQLKAQLMAIWGGSGMRQCGEQVLGEVTINLRTQGVSQALRNGGQVNAQWQQESTACDRPDASRVKIAGNLELRVVRENELDRARKGPSGSWRLSRRVVAIEIDGERVRWSHAVPPMDVTPWQ